MGKFIVIALALTLSNQPVHAGEGVTRYINAAALERLRCVKSWLQLCDVSDVDFPSMYLETNRVVFQPYMDEDESSLLVFKIKRRNGNRLALRSGEGEDALKATLTITGNHAVYEGPDPADQLRGTTRHVVLPLVKKEALWAHKVRLIKRLVPGGTCTELTGWEDDGKPAPCLNTRDGKPAPIAP